MTTLDYESRERYKSTAINARHSRYQMRIFAVRWTHYLIV